MWNKTTEKLPEREPNVSKTRVNMREIRFRAWDEGNKIMHYDFQFIRSGISGNDWILFVSDKQPLSPDELWKSNPYFSQQLKIEQYTGLTDRNGKAIYEGDIVVQDGHIWFDNGEANYRGTVEWVYSQWQVIAHCVNPKKLGILDAMNEGLNDDGIEEGERSNWEVIGDIHTPPELLLPHPHKMV